MIAVEQKTSAKTRVAVVAIAALMIISTGALFVSMALGSNNQEKINEILLAEQKAKEEKLNQMLEEYGNQLTAAADETNETYFATFAKYRKNIKSYVAANLTELKVKDLVVGEGDPLTDITDDNSLLYIGWLGNETVFDSSFETTANDDGATDPNAWKTATRVRFPTSATTDFITGFKEGLIGRVGGSSTGARICTDSKVETDDEPCDTAIEGLRVGGVREISIPYQKAYGETAFGDIPAMAPLKFIVMRVPYVVEPEPSDELYALYTELYPSE
ncbi:MAG: FKBP-type peptidyl-prolyl cis-trans isomerase [Candidatus Nomurabacteria bacterium]|jgi:FKBP-type peptidyl-prolyl cis-trans isomerase|nr:FKBP-type peptidyl-prolyl cis-trans isomerase [Candidatus Nomurabacteria bacterium]